MCFCVNMEWEWSHCIILWRFHGTLYQMLTEFWTFWKMYHGNTDKSRRKAQSLTTIHLHLKSSVRVKGSTLHSGCYGPHNKAGSFLMHGSQVRKMQHVCAGLCHLCRCMGIILLCCTQTIKRWCNVYNIAPYVGIFQNIRLFVRIIY